MQLIIRDLIYRSPLKDNYPRIYEDIRDIKVKDENLNLLCK